MSQLGIHEPDIKDLFKGGPFGFKFPFPKGAGAFGIKLLIKQAKEELDQIRVGASRIQDDPKDIGELVGFMQTACKSSPVVGIFKTAHDLPVTLVSPLFKNKHVGKINGIARKKHLPKA